jgi:hypothetical protein
MCPIQFTLRHCTSFIGGLALLMFICTQISAGPPVKLNNPLAGSSSVFRNSARFTPDGTRVFYELDLVNSGGYVNLELYSVPSGGGTAVKLSAPNTPVTPTYYVSPDSEHVYYTDFTDSGATRIFAVPSTGGPSTSLVSTSDPYRFYDINFSPDGTRFSYKFSWDVVSSQPIAGLPQLYSVPTTGGAPTLLAGRNWVATDLSIGPSMISPDGQHVVYFESDSGYPSALYSVPILGGTSRKLSGTLTPDPPSLYYPPGQFSPDGSLFVFFAGGIYSVPISGGTPVKLNGTSAYGGGSADRFSSDGSRFVYVTVQGNIATEIDSVPSAGGSSVKLNGPLLSGSVSSPVLSPDGTRVLYTAAQNTAGILELYEVPITGGPATRLNAPLGLGGIAAAVTWSPDNSRVIYEQRQETGAAFELYSVPSVGGAPVKLSGPMIAGGNVEYSVVISPDGSRVVYEADQEVDGVYSQYIVPTAGGTPVKISGSLHVADDRSPPKFSSDGSRILIETEYKSGVPAQIYSRVLRQRWINSTGDWDTASNWNYAELPDDVMQISIAGSSSVTATGNSVSRSVNELHLGGGAAMAALTLQSAAAITAVNGVVIESNGLLAGNGTLVGNLSNSGLIAPGTSVGNLQISGNYSQTTSGTIQIDLSNVEVYDQLQINGNASLAGSLVVSLIGGFTPSVGQTFNILDFASSDGTFNQLQLPQLANSLSWNTSRLYSNGSLSIVGGLTGDYNGDGRVDAADYIAWRKNGGAQQNYNTWRAHFGQSTSSISLPCDFNADGRVDAADYVAWRHGLATGTYTQSDYNTWRANFGATAAAAAAVARSPVEAVPEPDTLVVRLIALMALFRLPRAKHRCHYTHSRNFDNSVPRAIDFATGFWSRLRSHS